jgi:hypothetical protein
MADAENNKSGCYHDIFVKDSITISIATTSTCKPLADAFYNPGFIIGEFDLIRQEILWGKFDIYATYIKYILLDIDGDNRNEILSLFFDESSLWGYAHKIQISDSLIPILKTVEIPQSTYDSRDTVLYTVDDNSDVRLNAIMIDSDEAPVISYDKNGDSLFIKK